MTGHGELTGEGERGGGKESTRGAVGGGEAGCYGGMLNRGAPLFRGCCS
jgi:hypothetical protein